MNNNIRILKLSLLALISSIVCATTFSQTKINLDSSEIFIENYMKDNHVPGLVASVIKGDKIIWSKAYGYSDIENNIPMSFNSLMNIASISKTITTTAVLQLWEKGLIEFNSDINEYLPISIRNPNFPDEPITVQQILTHTSSINDGPAYFKSYVCGDPTVTLKHWITNYFNPNGEYYSEDNFFSWKPNKIRKPDGSRTYSNVAFGLLGYLVEEVTKMNFAEYCNENIFIPLGMDKTSWFLKDIDTNMLAVPYVFITPNNRDEEWIRALAKYSPQNKDLILNQNFPLCYYSFPNYPDGLIRTSVKELSYFLIAIINGGNFNDKQILKKSTVERMLTHQIEGYTQGLCWNNWEFESLWGHGGVDPGITTKMFFNPDTKIGMITFQNNNMGDASEILKELYLETKTK